MERRSWTLLAVCVATFMLLLDITVVNVALPDIQRDLNASLTNVQWVVDAYTLSLSALILTAGSLADRLGRRLIFIAGLAIFSLASLLCGLSTSSTFLDLARALQGVGGAAMFATSLALIAQEFPGPERAKALGIWGSTIGGAVAVGPLVGGLLTEGLGWEWIFFVNVPIGAAAIYLAQTRATESRDPHAGGIDTAGLITFSAALFLLVYGILRGNSKGWTSGVILGALIGATVLLIAFLVIEHRREHSMLDLSLFRKPAFGGVSLGTLAIGAGMFAMFLYLTLYIEDVLQLSPLETGLRFLPMTLMTFIVPIATSSLTERIPRRVTLAAGLATVGTGLLLMHGLTVNSDWTSLLAGFMVAGAGIGLANPSIAATALGVVPGNRSGMASGISNTCRVFGVCVGVAALGAVFEHGISSKLAQLAPGAPPGLDAAVASGGVHGAVGVAPGHSTQFVEAARAAFTSTLNELLLIGAVILFVGAICAFFMIRPQDFEPRGAPQPAAAPEPAA